MSTLSSLKRLEIVECMINNKINEDGKQRQLLISALALCWTLWGVILIAAIPRGLSTVHLPDNEAAN